MPVTCARPTTFVELIDYYAGELDPAVEVALEGHWADCSSCATAASDVASLISDATDLIAKGWALWAVTPSLLEKLRAAGLKILEGQAASGELLSLSETSGLDLLIGRLRGDFSAHKSVDVEFDTIGGRIVEAEVPVTDPHEIVIACVLHLRVPPGTPIRSRCRIIAGGQVLGEYPLSIDVSPAGS